MKKFLLFFLLLPLFLNLSAYADVKSKVYNFAEEITVDYQKKAGQILFKKRLAVLNLKELSPSLKKYETGKSISALLTTKLSESLIFILVERENIEKVLSEIELGMSGMIDEKTAPEAGKLLGAELLLDGSVSEIGDEINVDVKLVQAETGEIILTKNLTLPKDEVLTEAKSYYFTSFQSKYGISISGSVSFILPSNYRREIIFTSLNLGYRISKNLNCGIGYLNLGAPELIKEKDVQYKYNNETYNIYRNYNYSADGISIFIEKIISPLRWLNLGIRLETAFLNTILQQDIADFPVYIPSGSTNTLETKRILVESWLNANPVSALFNALGTIDILISRRVSLNFKFGYSYATEFLPTVYEAGGRRQWSNSAGDPQKMDEPDADLNGKFSEYHDFNFSRLGDGTGDRVKINIAGPVFGWGFSVHF